MTLSSSMHQFTLGSELVCLIFWIFHAFEFVLIETVCVVMSIIFTLICLLGSSLRSCHMFVGLGMEYFFFLYFDWNLMKLSDQFEISSSYIFASLLLCSAVLACSAPLSIFVSCC